MVEKKSPDSVRALAGTGKSSSASVSGAALPPNEQPGNDAIWDACREAKDERVKREAYVASRLETAGHLLGFTKNEYAVWTGSCPHCGHRAELSIPTGDSVRVTEYVNGVWDGGCAAIRLMRQILSDAGYAS